MHYYRICIECKKATPEQDVNVVILNTDEKQMYCGQCFQAISPEKIEQKSNKKLRSTKGRH